jgi:sodium transport system permease protein
MSSNTPSAPDGVAVFLVALAWTEFASLLLGERLGPLAVPFFTFGLVLIPLVVCALLRFNLSTTFSVVRATPLQFAGGLILSCGMLVATVVASILITKFFPELPVSGKALRTDITGASFPYLVVTVAFLPAVCEEFLFRGFILTSFMNGGKHFHGTLAVVSCGIMFGFLHLEPAQIPMTALIGIALSWVCVITGSVFVPVAMHAFHNFVLLLLFRYGSSILPTSSFGLLVYAGLAMALIDAGFFLLRKSTRRTRI